MISDSVPRFETHMEAAATPMEAQHEPTRSVRGAIYDRDGQLILLSQRIGGVDGERFPSDDPQRIDLSTSAAAVRWPGRTLYLGHHMNHYGHFLSEMLPTLWMLGRFGEYDNLAFHPFIFGSGRPAFMNAAFAALELPTDRIRLISTNTRFDELTVCERLVTLNHSANAHARSVYRHLADHFCAASSTASGYPDCLYFSRVRTSLRNGSRSIANEAALERWFERRGFAIVYPECLELAEQVRLVRNARIICGTEGSAMHNVVFATPGTRVITIGNARSEIRRRSAAHPAQAICNLLGEVDASFVPFRGKIIDDRRRICRLDIDGLTEHLDGLLPPAAPHRSRGNPSFRSSRLRGVRLEAWTFLRRWRSALRR